MITRLLAGVTAAAVAVSGLALAAPSSPVAAFAPADGPVFINEVHYDNTGTDTGEAVEIAGADGLDLDGWSLVLYNGSGGAEYTTTPLSGVIDDEGNGAGTIAFSYPSNGIQNGSPDGIALVDPGGTVAQFLSYEGAFTAIDGPAAALMSTDIGVAENGSEPVGGSLGLVGTGGVYGDFTWATMTTSSFGSTNPGQTFDGTTPLPDPPEPPARVCPVPPAVSPISQVQGTGDVTPCAGEDVVIEGVVVGDYEGASPTLRGFYVQQTDDSNDADPATSEGIFVFNASNDSVALGNLVQVAGEAAEFQGQTQLGDVTAITVLDRGNAVTPAALSLPVASPTALEASEGMLARFAQTLAVTELFQLGRFGQIVVSSQDRLEQPTQVVEPGAAAQALQAQNDLDRLIVDDALNNQNPDPIVLGRGGKPLSAMNTLRGGDTVTGAVGVLSYTWAGNSASGNAYRLRVEDDLSDSGLVAGGVIPKFRPTNRRPSRSPAVRAPLRVASMNVLNYFLTLDEGTNQCGPAGFEQDCRGANNEEELERQRTKLLAALRKINGDIVGLIELENSTGVEPLADIVAGLNATEGAGAYDYIETGTIGTDAIKVGIIYRTAAVAPLGAPAILDSSVDPRFDDDRNRPTLAQSFRDRANGGVLTIAVNHLKSKSCSEATGADADQGDGQACWNATRTSAAEALVDWLDGRPTGVADDDNLVVGDLNSYAMEDPIDVLVDAGYVDLGDRFGDGYSYVFDGQWGTLDYQLASPSLAGQVRRAVEYHINADEPPVLDYNTEFKSAGQIASLYAPNEFRVSDHDPIVSGIKLRDMLGTIRVKPRTLAPPDHEYRLVRVTAGRGTAVTILEATSSEADSGLGDDDRPNDIVLLGGNEASLRAEAYAPEGRTYTLFVSAQRGGQTRYGSVTVKVPQATPAQ